MERIESGIGELVSRLGWTWDFGALVFFSALLGGLSFAFAELLTVVFPMVICLVSTFFSRILGTMTELYDNVNEATLTAGVSLALYAPLFTGACMGVVA